MTLSSHCPLSSPFVSQICSMVSGKLPSGPKHAGSEDSTGARVVVQGKAGSSLGRLVLRLPGALRDKGDFSQAQFLKTKF